MPNSAGTKGIGRKILRIPAAGVCKKLIEAARYWANGGVITGDFDLDDSLVAQLRGLGAPQDVIEQASSRKQRGDFEVYPENWETLSVFLRLGSQWRIVGGMGGMMYQGIDFGAIEPCLRLMGIKPKKWPRVFEAIMAMSDEAASVINERQKANA